MKKNYGVWPVPLIVAAIAIMALFALPFLLISIKAALLIFTTPVLNGQIPIWAVLAIVILLLTFGKKKRPEGY